MTANGILQLVLFFGIILILTKPMGSYMARVFQGEQSLLSPLLRPVERVFYKLFGVKEDEEMKWTTYSFSLLMFSLVGATLTYALLRLQGHLPLNPQNFGGKEMTADLSIQHRSILYHQHQLAELRAGSDGELLFQYGLAGGPQLDVGRGRDRRCHRPGARFRPAFGERPRKFLG